MPERGEADRQMVASQRIAIAQKGRPIPKKGAERARGITAQVSGAIRVDMASGRTVY